MPWAKGICFVTMELLHIGIGIVSAVPRGCVLVVVHIRLWLVVTSYDIILTPNKQANGQIYIKLIK